MELGLQGKRAIVTGGSKGIGLATATRLAMEGARVAIVARRPDGLQAAHDAILALAPGATVIRVSADVSTSQGASEAVERAVAEFGGLDIVVNNAGTAAAGPFLNHPDETWQADLDLKLFGAIRVSRLAIPHLQQAGGGRIVNVTAIGGKAPGPGSAPSSVSRAAGLAVNAVCIGLVESEQIERAARARAGDAPLEEGYRLMGEAVPLRRVGKPAEAGDVIAFLCSERASYVTGVAINIDGGMSAVI